MELETCYTESLARDAVANQEFGESLRLLVGRHTPALDVAMEDSHLGTLAALFVRYRAHLGRCSVSVRGCAAPTALSACNSA